MNYWWIKRDKDDIERNNFLWWWHNNFIKRYEVEVQRGAIELRAGCHNPDRACWIQPNPRPDRKHTEDTPKSHQCGFIAQSVQQIDELKNAVVGGVVGEDGVESIRHLNCNAYTDAHSQSHWRATWGCQATSTTERQAKATVSLTLIIW